MNKLKIMITVIVVLPSLLLYLSADIDSSPSMVVLISVHLLKEHWLFHGCAPASGTEVSLLWDRACGTTDDQLRTV